ncbi:hypothetical protein H5410_027761, partial [Solanum commersonii]
QAKLEEIESQQEESYGETEIVSKSWLQEQTQLLKFQEFIHQFGSYIHGLEADLNKKIEASKAQLPIVVDDDQLVVKKEEFHTFKYIVFLSIDVEKEYKNEKVVKSLWS